MTKTEKELADLFDAIAKRLPPLPRKMEPAWVQDRDGAWVLEDTGELTTGGDPFLADYDDTDCTVRRLR